MLFVLFKSIQWTKDQRTPEYGSRRQEFLKPDTAVLNQKPDLIYNRAESEGHCILKEILCYQKGGDILPAPYRLKPQTSQKIPDRTSFSLIPLEEVMIPDIEILPEENRYRIRWFDSGRGSIRRRGGNEDFLKRGARFSGEPNRLNETAFILKPGQSGTVCCNNRFSSWHGQWYEEYRIYFVSAVRPDRNMFVREPDFRYEQLAVLF